MSQLGLDFTPPRARRSDPETSHTAAKRVAPEAGALRRAVLGALRARSDGMTAPEIAVLVGTRDGSISPRMIELKKLGLARVLKDDRDEDERRDGARIWVTC